MLKQFVVFLTTILFLLVLTVVPTLAQVPEELSSGCGDNQVATALGCISTTAEGEGGFVESILGLAVGIGGAVALLLLLYGFFLLSTSQGSPDKVKHGKEIITSAIAGLIFVTMSVVLMAFIGINILGIPGLS